MEDTAEDYVDFVPARKRRDKRAGPAAGRRGGGGPVMGGARAAEAGPAQERGAEAHPPPNAPPPQRNTESLLLRTIALRAAQPVESEAEKLWKEEQQLLRDVTEKRALMSAAELAAGATGANNETGVDAIAVPTGWRPPEKARNMPEAEKRDVRERLKIIAEGIDVPAPLETFAAMKLPRPLVRRLEVDGIVSPTPIQMQGLPVILSGRDMIGVSFTGSGKTLAFLLPMLMTCAAEEVQNPLRRGEGPVGFVLCPSRELARQTYEVLEKYSAALSAPGAEPPLPPLTHFLCIGGVDSKPQLDALREGPVHGIVATPGRLKDFLDRRRITLRRCRYLCLDEADRMILDNDAGGFEEDLRHVISFTEGQRRQTVMFSATLPTKIKTFAKSAMVEPVMVNVGRAGAANLNIVQEVEYVKDESKATFLLECLQKTAPPVIIFSASKDDVNHMLEYLLIKGVDACAVHGDMDQTDRTASVEAFKRGEKDVLIATDVAGKGLDFPAIQHVINYDMPNEIEFYCHRIGRTGRGGKTGVATSFINKNVAESTLLDLKHLLREAKQHVPPMLMTIDDPAEHYDELEKLSGTRGCIYCGGLGHRIAGCPKLSWEAEGKTKTMRGTLASERAMYGAEM